MFNNNTYYDPACGDPKELKSKWGEDGGVFRGVDVPVIDVTCFYTFQNQPFRNAAGQPVTFQSTENQLGQSNVRTFPTTMPNVRFMNHHLLDFGLTKNFTVGDRVRVQVRIEALNATNYTLFAVGQCELHEQPGRVHDAEQHRLEHGDEAARHPAWRAGDVLSRFRVSTQRRRTDRGEIRTRSLEDDALIARHQRGSENA